MISSSSKRARLSINAMIGRDKELFAYDILRHEKELTDSICGSRVLVFGGAGSIGKEVVHQIFRRGPDALHVIDISENNLVELVRDLRSSLGYIEGETLFLPLDCGSVETAAFLSTQKPYDYVLNIAAMKHVRSEKDAYSLMRMITTNILDIHKTLMQAAARGTKKYFAVSTDKAKNPANLMGATKRIMEDVIFGESGATPTAVSTARFANVAFSDGSLLHGFRQRLLALQPISAPRDVRRYFVTGPESGMLCLMSLVLGDRRDIFFPNLDAGLDLLTFSDIAVRFLEAAGYEPVEMDSEEEARCQSVSLINNGKWPCFFFNSDTPGEKPFEEFYSGDDNVSFAKFRDVGVISSPEPSAQVKDRYKAFLAHVNEMREHGSWTESDLASAIGQACPELSHIGGQRSLDDKM